MVMFFFMIHVVEFIHSIVEWVIFGEAKGTDG